MNLEVGGSFLIDGPTDWATCVCAFVVIPLWMRASTWRSYIHHNAVVTLALWTTAPMPIRSKINWLVVGVVCKLSFSSFVRYSNPSPIRTKWMFICHIHNSLLFSNTVWFVQYASSSITVVLSCGSERKKEPGIWPSPSLDTIFSESEFIKIKKILWGLFE